MTALAPAVLYEGSGIDSMSSESSNKFRIDRKKLPDEEVLFGSTRTMREVRETILRVCDTDLPILIRGETGTGKELVAQYIHCRSRLCDGPFVKVNCAAIPLHLLESELLGYEKGAFTGASESKPGLVELADGGTLFLDEIGDMSGALQAKLLHLLQDGKYARIGGREERQAQVRVICATHCDLERAVNEGTFRSDLFYRIDVINLRLLALRDRRDDIPQLYEHFRGKLAEKFGKSAPSPNSLVLHLLAQWEWPGNIRELESWVLREIVFGADEALKSELGRQAAVATTATNGRGIENRLKTASRESAKLAEHALILKHLQANQWSRRKTSKDLNISYRSLLYKLRELGIPSTRRKTLVTPINQNNP